MKVAAFIVILIVSTLTAFSQDIAGQWNGLMEVPGVKLKVVINITKTETGYSSTMDSPDQGVKGIPISQTSFDKRVLRFENLKAKFHYEGTLNMENVFEGKFSQGGQLYPLNLSRAKFEASLRPQEPKPPFPYYSEDIKFENPQAKIELAGTLTIPKKDGVFPAVVLITGSGPQNRNEEVLGHKPFLLIADYLTRRGIAVLRFDDRGTFESKGSFATATTLDFSTDVESAVAYLKSRKDINKKKIGLIGHSEGGMIAPLIAAHSKDIDFIVLLAGPGIPGDQLLLLQGELIGRAKGGNEEDLKRARQINGGAYDLVKNATDQEKLRIDLTSYLKKSLDESLGPNKPIGMNEDAIVGPQVSQLMGPWLQSFIKFDPSLYLRKVKCPVLALNGENDLQVPAKIDLAAIKNALVNGGNQRVTIMEFPKLNHLFQESKTGLPDEYGAIEQTMSPAVLQEIAKWVTKQIN